MRIEKDALGEIAVPDEAYYGAQTQRAVENFPIGDERLPAALIQGLALCKKVAARVHQELGLLDADVGDAIVQAADEVLDGGCLEQFPLLIWQSGSGTQSNMNMNEVLANRASELLGGKRGQKEPVHPNDHVNMGQSTNDMFPTAMHVAVVGQLRSRLLPSLHSLVDAFERKSTCFADIVKIGRTHLQDATPLTLGQEFSGYAMQVQQGLKALEGNMPELQELAAGGTAVGTGLNTHPDFGRLFCESLSHMTGEAFQPQTNRFAGLAAHDAMARVSGNLRSIAAALFKIANDIRWMGSGPRSGLGELTLPANEPGSSIMPGKINPTQCEMLTMVCCRVYGNDAAIAMAASQGQFELNVYKPLIAHAVLQAITLLADACDSFRERCLEGLVANKDRMQSLVESSLMLVTALNPHIGYDRAAALALQAWQEGRTLRDVALAAEDISAEQFDAWVQPVQMTNAGSKSE